MDIREKKKNIRKDVSVLKKILNIEQKNSFSKDVFAFVETLEEFKKAKTVLLYYAMKDEVQTEFFLKKWCDSKRIVLPVVVGDDLIFREYFPDKVAVGYQSILEPTDTAIVDFKEIDFAIIPGVAFDRNYNRLGRGKGFYDRILSSLNCDKVGVCYSLQLVKEIPVEDFDKPMTKVVTEFGILG